MPAMLIRLNKIPQISIMAVFVISLLSILGPNENFDPSLVRARARARVTELVEPVLVL